MAIINSFTETSEIQTWKKIETMAPTRRVTQTTNITPREKKIQTQTVFKQTENKIMQQNWFKHN